MFECIEECEACFEHLKQFLMHATVLEIVDPEKEFVVCTDACNRGLGRVRTMERWYVMILGN